MVKDCNANWLDDGPIVARHSGTSISFENDAIEVIVTRLDLEPEAVLASTALLSDAERQRASRLVFDRDRRRFTVARARLRQLLAARLGARPESVEFVYGTRGKPMLPRHWGTSVLRFNVSHTEDVTVFAFSAGREIGVDVESVRMIPDADDIAERFFSRRENASYRALDPSDRPLGFLNCWTRKEAFVKALGDGLSHPLDHFDVSLAPGAPARILRVESTSGNDCGWMLHAFVPGPGLIGAIVVEEPSHELASRVGPGRIAISSLRGR